ncbi:MAG: sodium:proton antiporter NhaD [Petrimonas sp.]|uniref:sodium:proton antiporter NhaD n=1 Tax=Petrimonas sp. TaxID=2023866 RepID=UPI002B3DFD58|nr:sodium:proton antiporter NhaD [Petrimonas sp.]
MIYAMIFLFIAGYLFIAMEHTIKVNKASIALLIGTLLWVIYVYLAPSTVLSVSPDAFNHYIHSHPELQHYAFGIQVRHFVIDHQILESIGDISEMLFFLLAAMTIVELIDVHGGFTYITEKITTRKKRRLLWLISFITFFMSAVLDNLTTTIVMIMLTRRIISEPRERWLFGSIIVIAANSGGAWSPIGDVTTIMLWVKGNITASIIPQLFFPSLISMVAPVFVAQFLLKGNIQEKEIPLTEEKENADLLFHMQKKDQLGILIFGVSILVLSPVFKGVTHLPPFIGLLLGVSLLWIYTEILYNQKNQLNENLKLRVSKVLGRIDFSTLMFFLGILLAVDALQSAGILQQSSAFMAQHLPNVYAQAYAIGLLSAIVDNVPLVAAAIGMYPVLEPAALSTMADPVFMQNFVEDGVFWHFLAYCAGVGGSILIIGSAAGVVFMGLEKVPFGWYLKRISLIALIGYTFGAGAYILQQVIF